jgi:hypothetical protein
MLQAVKKEKPSMKKHCNTWCVISNVQTIQEDRVHSSITALCKTVHTNEPSSKKAPDG